MKSHLLTFALGLLVALLAMHYAKRFSAELMPVAQAQSQIELPTRGRACAAAILLGNYAFTLEGDVITGNNSGPYAGVGVLAFDGAGGASLLFSQNYNGQPTPAVLVAGRYTLGDDCAGLLIFNTGARFDIVANNSGREVNLLQTNQGSVIYGIAKKQ